MYEAFIEQDNDDIDGDAMEDFLEKERTAPIPEDPYKLEPLAESEQVDEEAIER